MLEISVVLASLHGGPGLSNCLAVLEDQVATAGGEIVVVHSSGASPSDGRSFPFCRTRWIPMPSGAEVPHLWKAGIEVSKGKIVALLVDSCVPRPDWVDRVLRAHQSSTAVIGGAIELAPAASLVDSAVYFCRYSRYMPPFEAQFLDDLPGTGCSYKREALNGLKEEMADGFWETFIHKTMRNRDERLLCDPAIAVTHVGPSSFVSFLRLRFAHGRKFAARQAAAMRSPQRIIRALAFPLVPFVMFRRIAARVWTTQRYRTRFLACSPAVGVFLAAWSAGEFLGFLCGPSRGTQQTSAQQEGVLREVV